MTARIVPVGDIELCVETFGDDTDPTVLLIGGLSSSMDGWDPDFCAALADGGRYVVRYDHRDTGQSTTWPTGEPDYTGRDLVDDAIGLLDALGVDRANIVGVSAGGGIAQTISLLRPARVVSLTLIATSPAVATPVELPGSIDPIASYFADPPPEPDWNDRAAVIEHLVDAERIFAGPAHFDEGRARSLITRTVDRSPGHGQSAGNHWLVDGGESVERPLSDIATPTLVIHGTADALFPIAHGEALAAAIPNARFIVVDGMGHQAPPPPCWPTVIPELLALTGRGWPRVDEV